MCSLKEAQRHEQLAMLFAQENNLQKAREHFLEAASIYVLQAELTKDDSLLKNANQSYARSTKMQMGKGTNQTLMTEKSKEVDPQDDSSINLSKAELAARTLAELHEIQSKGHALGLRELVHPAFENDAGHDAQQDQHHSLHLSSHHHPHHHSQHPPDEAVSHHHHDALEKIKLALNTRN